MKITKASKSIISVEMSKNELDEYGITYSQLDYSERRTRNMINSVICRVQKEVDESYTLKGKTQIEVMPDGNSGCLLIFTKLSKGDLIRNTLRLLS